MKPISCNEVVDSSMCGKDHSRLVCNSGIAYCLSSQAQCELDHNSATLSYLQDVETVSGEARLFWDTGANRVLIDDEFAK